MKTITQEWVDKAEEDWSSLDSLFRVRKSPHHNTICFLAQQCAEKYLKGRLVEAGIKFPKTHALPMLLSLALTVEPTWDTLHKALVALNPYSVLYRYPGFTADRDQAKDARKHCETVRAAVRVSLGLP
jgi:HEPN domain-containing protein